MTVVKTPTSTSPASSTQSTTASGRRNVQTSTSPVSSTTSSAQQSMTSTSAERDDGSQVVITVGVCVAVLLLLFVIILILIYKRCSHSKHTRNGAAAQHTREDYIYEEVQERPETRLRNAVTTIYATANFPTNPSASLDYSTINFKNSSDKAGGEAVILKTQLLWPVNTLL
ncbi:uncharacterized protein LOC118328434 isoform X2 [Morone saxatilis]|uniref:uncharacterized protein LOC118328434 isoform X2 n=1 Tax=Morone saxatilis TaxID=34816 RepID=UPI0015E22FDF|nr:uncharacterized protein LOC118328434 isoform X2 [Morone saxatilis]